MDFFLPGGCRIKVTGAMEIMNKKTAERTSLPQAAGNSTPEISRVKNHSALHSSLI